MTQQRALQKIRGLPYDVNKLQDNVSAAITPILTNPLNYGIILPNVEVPGAAPVTIEHKLGRQPLGWIVIDKTKQADVWKISWSDKFITLDSSAVTSINLYIF